MRIKDLIEDVWFPPNLPWWQKVPSPMNINEDYVNDDWIPPDWSYVPPGVIDFLEWLFSQYGGPYDWGETVPIDQGIQWIDDERWTGPLGIPQPGRGFGPNWDHQDIEDAYHQLYELLREFFGNDLPSDLEEWMQTYDDFMRNLPNIIPYIVGEGMEEFWDEALHILGGAAITLFWTLFSTLYGSGAGVADAGMLPIPLEMYFYGGWYWTGWGWLFLEGGDEHSVPTQSWQEEGWQYILPPYGPPGMMPIPGSGVEFPPGFQYLWPPPEGYNPWDPSTWGLPIGWDPQDPSTWNMDDLNDTDGDGIPNDEDDRPDEPWVDTDGDGLPDYVDPDPNNHGDWDTPGDWDNDGFPDTVDPPPWWGNDDDLLSNPTEILNPIEIDPDIIDDSIKPNVPSPDQWQYPMPKWLPYLYNPLITPWLMPLTEPDSPPVHDPKPFEL